MRDDPLQLAVDRPDPVRSAGLIEGQGTGGGEEGPGQGCGEVEEPQ